MPNAEYPDALAALRAAVRRGERSVEVACPNADCSLELLLFDDTAPRRDGFGRAQYEEAIYVIEPGEEHDPEAAQLTFCPGCDGYLAPDVVVLRAVDAIRSVA